MAVYTYTGKLADFGDTPFPNAKPRLWVSAEHSAMSGGSVLALKRVPITVAANGTFSVSLVASADLTPVSKYVLRAEWLDGETIVGWTDWIFTALIGGGQISNMPDGAITNVWYSTSQPPVRRAGIIWIHPVTGDVREWV